MIAAVLTNLLVQADCVIFPITNSLYETYPESSALINYVLSGPQLFLLATSLLTPLMLTKVSKRVLIKIGAVIGTIGTVFGAAVDSAAWMAFMRTLVGISMGIVNVCAVALISDVYLDEKKRAVMTGIFSFGTSMSAVVLGYFTGVMAADGWRNVFKLYYLMIPMMLLVLFCIPKMTADTPVKAAVEEKKEHGKSNSRLGAEFWEMVVTFFFEALILMIASYFMAVYVAEKGIGTEAVTGNAVSIAQIIVCVFTFTFGFYYKKLGRWILPICYLFTVATFVMWLVAASTWAVYAVFILDGFAFSVGLCYCYARVPAIVPEDKISLGISIVTATYGIGSFLTTYFVTFLQRILHTDTVYDILFVPLAIAVVVLAVDVVFAFIGKRKAAAVE